MLNFSLVEILTYLPIKFVLCTETKLLFIQKGRIITEIQVKQILSTFKTNVDIIGITVSIWKIYDFETIFTSNDVTNIQDAIGKYFGSIER